MSEQQKVAQILLPCQIFTYLSAAKTGMAKSSNDTAKVQIKSEKLIPLEDFFPDHGVIFSLHFSDDPK